MGEQQFELGDVPIMMDDRVPPNCFAWMRNRIRLSIDISMHLIQSIRLAQAVMEAGFSLQLKADQEKALFDYLSGFFPNLSYSMGNGARELPEVEIIHALPQTRIGTIVRPLIFPRAVIREFRRQWSPERSLTYYFCGFVMREREEFLALASRLSPVIQYSMAGRTMPIKAWDPEYVTSMCNSRFALCPPGDCDWTYRFFESALSGAIPVISRPVPVYEGFEYVRIEDATEGAAWDAELADRNFRRALDLLSVMPSDLRWAIMGQLS